MSEETPVDGNTAVAAATAAAEFLEPATPSSKIPAPSRSNIPTPASSVTGIPVSKLKTPSSYGSTSSISKIGRPCCTHTTPKAGPPPRDTNSMSRESDDNLSSINSAYTDLYQETVKRFTRSSLSPTSDWERSSPARRSLKSTTPLSDNERRTSYDYYLEATGRRRSSDHNSAVLTANTEQFIIGQRVWVGGIRPGQIAYIGETHFAPGDWAGVVLDEPNGKNDGCVSGKRYFQCEPKRGIFSRLTRLTVYPMSGAVTPTSPLAKHSPERSRTVSPTASVRSSMLRSPGTGKNGLTVGDRVIVSSGFGSRPGILRYLGETQFAPGNWCGVELDEASGKNDGAVDGIRYFECKPKYGVFVPIAKVSLSPSTLKKTRLSRTGSRESLTSIGTMNSIATTNTSRMRMNAQQRKSSTPIRPIATTPKSQFSMQDLLREKSHHVEQLMKERELDREDAQNQALQLQKNINELKDYIVKLESQLGDERKKSEELQFSIDEAQFCGDELTAQTQVYKEKVEDLQKKIILLSNSSSQQSALPIEDNTALLAAQAQVTELQDKLIAQEKQNETRVTAMQDEEQRLLDKIKYMQGEMEAFQAELLGKDENLEKFSLSQSGIENLRRELTLLKEENEKQAQLAQTAFEQKLASSNEEVAKVTAELQKLRSASSALESENVNAKDECDILQTEIKIRDEQINELSQQVDDLSVQLSVQKADSSVLDEMLKAQKMGSAQSQTALEEKIADYGKLKAAHENLERLKNDLDQQLLKVNEELSTAKQQQSSTDEQLKASNVTNEQKENSLTELRKSLQALQDQLNAKASENDQLKSQLDSVSASQTETQQCGQQLQQKLAEQEKSCAELTQRAQLAEAQVEQLQKEATASSEQSATQVLSLTTELTQLRASLSEKESNAANASNTMSARIAEMEAQTQQLQQRLQESEACAAEAQAKLATLQTQHLEQTNQLEIGSSTIQKLSDEHEAVKANSVMLEGQLKLNTEVCAQRELELGDVTRKYEATEAKCKELGQQFDSLQTELLAARGSATEMQTALKQLNEELLTKQKSYADLENQSSSQRMELASDNELLKQTNARLERELNECKEALNKLQANDAEKQGLLAKLEEQNIKQELALSDANRQQENLQARCESLAQQNETLQQQLTALRTSSTDSNVELLKLSEDVIAKQKAIEELSNKSSDERAALEGQLQASQQRVDALCSQVELLTQELKTSTEQSAQLNATLKAEQDQASKQSLELSDAMRKLEVLNSKCTQLEQDNTKVQQDLSTTRNSGTEMNAKLLQLTEQLAAAQKELSCQRDARSAERLQLEHELQETRQQRQADQSSGLEEASKLQENIKDLQERLEITNAELQHKEQLAREDSQKIADLKKLVEAIQVANANISATNAELSTVLEVLQAEKSETAHIFELFEMEADMNAERLIEKLTNMKEELQQSHALLATHQANQTEMEQKLKTNAAEVEQLQQSEAALRASNLESSEKLRELQQANEELQQALQQKQTLLEKGNEFDLQLAEYQKVIDEMDDAATAKTTLMDQLQKRVSELEAALRLAQEAQQKAQQECQKLAQNLEMLELEKTREIVALRNATQSNGLVPKNEVALESLDSESSLAKINFLNSIIADMQQKNDALKAKVQTLEMLPTDFTKPHAFDLLTKRKPAPRMFCDICDEFDKHETEDCPLQAADDLEYSPPPTAEANNNEKERKLPAPRKYCDSCEVFGHDTTECADDETY